MKNLLPSRKALLAAVAVMSLSLVCAPIVSAQILPVTVVAGTGALGNIAFPSGNGSPAITVTLGNIYGVAVISNGNVYFSEGFGSVRKVDTNGILSTVAGNRTYGFSGDGGPATQARLSEPFGITFDVNGNLFIADPNNCRIRKVDTSGTITTFAGNGSCAFTGDAVLATQSGLSTPVKLSFDAHGNLFIADLGSRRVRKIDGFFQPIENDLTFNVMKAGRAVPVKFRLGGDMGLAVFAPGYPGSAPIACSSTAPVDAVEETLAAGSNSLSYNAVSGQYNFIWKTESSWVNTCRQLVVQYRDGSLKRANFKFTK